MNYCAIKQSTQSISQNADSIPEIKRGIIKQKSQMDDHWNFCKEELI